jgi:hypothetical protein
MRVRPSVRLAAGLDEHVLAHHPAVLVLQEVAMEHVRGVPVAVVAEADSSRKLARAGE